MRQHGGPDEIRVGRVLKEMRLQSRRRQRRQVEGPNLWAMYEKKYETGTLTQRQLAGKLGCSQTYVSKYESGTVTLSVPQVEDIVRELGSNLSTFVRLYERSGQPPEGLPSEPSAHLD